MSAHSSKGDSLTVALRPVAMQMAAAYAEAAVDETDLAANPEAAKLLRLFQRRGSDSGERVRVKLPIAAAIAFAEQVRDAAAELAPGLLVDAVPGGLNPLPADGQIDGPPPNRRRVSEAVPVSAQAAMVELAREIYTALRAGAGRPMRVDPLIARETLAKVRKDHKRASGGRQPSPLLKAAFQLGVSVGTVERALPAGRDAEDAIKAAVKMLPQGAAPLYAQVDYDKKEVVLTAGLFAPKAKKKPAGR